MESLVFSFTNSLSDLIHATSILGFYLFIPSILGMLPLNLIWIILADQRCPWTKSVWGSPSKSSACKEVDLRVFMISILLIYLTSGALFELSEGQGKYLLGRCAADGEGSPSWEWAMVEDSEQDLVFSNGTIPICGGY